MKQAFFAILLIIAVQLQAGNWVNIQSPTPSKAKIELVSSSASASTVRFSLDGFFLEAVQTPRGQSYTIALPGASAILTQGAPDLPKLTASLQIPDLAQMGAEVVSSQYTDYQNIRLVPSKGNLSREVDPREVPFYYGPAYQTDADFPGMLCDTRAPYIIRDIRGQTLIAYPFQYNPVTQTLRVYHDLVIQLKKLGNNGENPFLGSKKKAVKEYHSFYGDHFLNYQVPEYTPVEEEGSMLIISYGAFIPAMEPFVNWKISKGIDVEIVDVASIGNSQAIRVFIQNYYLEHEMAYLLLVGDHQQVPSFNATSGYSDNSYGYLSGNDHYNDVLVGRFSAQNVDEVNTHVEKVLYYEISPLVSTNWFESCIGIASEQGPGDDNEMDYEHIRNLQTACDAYTYNTFYELFDGSQGGLDAPGDPSPTQVATALNEGASVVLYCGHGSQTSWGSSGFSNSHVNNLTNYGKLPFIWSVACVNGDFTNATCFAEAWLRARQGSELTGAIATLMSTINQSWNPPMEGEDEMVAIMTEAYPNNIKRTFGGISMNGCAQMIDAYGSGGESMADTWVLFGDPSIVIRTAMPEAITATHDPTVFLGTTQFQVNCPVNGALACISLNNQILGTSTVNGGLATISFAGLSTIDTLTLVITAYNHIPYIVFIPIITASGPYIAYQAYQVNDPQGNGNGLPDFGEDIALGLTLKNLGVATANNVTATLSTGNAYITITDNTHAFGNINANTSANQSTAFAFSIANDIPDQHLVVFNLAINDGNGGNWNTSFSMAINAPEFAVGLMEINDASGNNNGVADPGENISVSIPSNNNGHADAPATIGTLSTLNPYITITLGTHQFNTLAFNSSEAAAFTFTVSPVAPIGTPVELLYTIQSGLYTSQKIFTITIGQIFEDFETGNFTKFSWVSTGSNAPWVISTENPYEGAYCAKSGTIGNSQSSILQLTLEVIANDSISFYRKVSSEDTYDFLAFFIDATKMEEWSGEQGWERFSYPVTAGIHTFKWRYRKDNYATAGSDAAWVDEVVFPPVSIATGLNHAPDATATTVDIYPNPANDVLFIDFSLEQGSLLSLSVLDLSGKTVKVLMNENLCPAGNHAYQFSMHELETGMYLIRYQTSTNIITRKLILNR